MRTMINAAVLMIALAVTVSASAETLQCESENVKISGHIETRYLRMGHSLFSGDLDVLVYDNSQFVSASTLTVFSGDIQDESSISSSMAKDERGRSAQLNIFQDRASLLQIGNSSLSFSPHCEILTDATVPTTCSSSVSLGQSCQTVQGKCVCHQHNGH